MSEAPSEQGAFIQVNPESTCFTSIKVQILTLIRLTDPNYMLSFGFHQQSVDNQVLGLLSVQILKHLRELSRPAPVAW